VPDPPKQVLGGLIPPVEIGRRRVGIQGRLHAVDTEPDVITLGSPLAGDPLEAGPVRPSQDVRAELATLLDADQSRLGQVYRGLQRALDAGSIAAELQMATSPSTFVWNL